MSSLKKSDVKIMEKKPPRRRVESASASRSRARAERKILKKTQPTRQNFRQNKIFDKTEFSILKKIQLMRRERNRRKKLIIFEHGIDKRQEEYCNSDNRLKVMKIAGDFEL